MIRAIVNGGGRMAQSIRDNAAGRDAHPIEVVGIVSPHPPEWMSGEAHAVELDDLGVSGDIVIDFSLPDGTLAAAEWCRDNGLPLVSGVTGLEEIEFAALDRAAERVAVLWAPNMSVGVNLLESVCRNVARALGPDARVRIHDVHHQWKLDAPSGTALALGRAIGAADGGKRPDPVYTSDREGEVVGLHRVRFEWDGEVLEFMHEALDRSIFARGALSAAEWLSAQPPGRYRASDWLSGG